MAEAEAVVEIVDNAEVEGEPGEVMWNNNGVEQPIRNAVLIPPAKMQYVDIQMNINTDCRLFPEGDTLEDHNLYLLETGNYSDTLFYLVEHNVYIRAHLHFFVTKSKRFREHLLRSSERPFIMCIDGVISLEAFSAFMRCMYTNRLDLDLDRAVEVLFIANIFDVKHLLNRCSSLLRSIISTQTALSVLLVACRCGQPDLKKDVMEFISRFTTEVCDNPDFVNLSPELLEEIVKNNALKISEYELFKYTVKWAHAECKRLGLSVTEHTPTILKPFLPYIRFPLMTADQLYNYVRLVDVLPKDTLSKLIEYVNKVKQGDCKPNVTLGFETIPRIPTYTALMYRSTNNQEANCYMTVDKDAFFEEFRFRTNVDMEFIGLGLYGSGLENKSDSVEPIQYEVSVTILGKNPRQISPTSYEFTVTSHEDFEIIMQSTYPIYKSCLYHVKVKIRGQRRRFGTNKIGKANFAVFGGETAVVEFLEREDVSSFSHRGVVRGVMFTVT